MRLCELLRDVEVLRCDYPPQTDVRDVSADSRLARDGSVFVALCGARHDGDDFAEQAAKNGAIVVTQKTATSLHKCIIVKDARRAYSLLQRNLHGAACDSLRLYAVTGTNGKTTTAALLAHILGENGRSAGVCGTLGIYDGRALTEPSLTTPDAGELHTAFSRMRAHGVSDCVLEASSHALKQQRLAGMRFTVGVFTNLGRDHLDYHKTSDDYFAAKLSLFPACESAAVNADDPRASDVLAACRGTALSFGLHAPADVRAVRVSFGSLTRFNIEYNNSSYAITQSPSGEAGVYNALAAFTAAVLAGVAPRVAANALCRAPQIEGRFEPVFCAAPVEVVVDFAHTPAALEAALRAVRCGLRGKLVAVFGCGGERDVGKRREMGEIACRLADFTVITVCNPRGEDPRDIMRAIRGGFSEDNFALVEDRRRALELALRLCRAGDRVLVAGKGHERYIEQNGVKTPYDDRVAVADAGRILRRKLALSPYEC